MRPDGSGTAGVGDGRGRTRCVVFFTGLGPCENPRRWESLDVCFEFETNDQTLGIGGVLLDTGETMPSATETLELLGAVYCNSLNSHAAWCLETPKEERKKDRKKEINKKKDTHQSKAQSRKECFTQDLCPHLIFPFYLRMTICVYI